MDYIPTQYVTFDANSTKTSVIISMCVDNETEMNETLHLTISGVLHKSPCCAYDNHSVTITIIDDDGT